MSTVRFWAASNDGSSWYRTKLPAAALSWAGHTVSASELLLPSDREADVIVGSRIAEVGASETWAELARGDGGPLMVLDLDDDYFNVEPRNRAAAQFWNTDQVQHRLAQNIRMADRVTVASEGIAESVARHTGHLDIRVVPNGLHAAYLGRPRDYQRERVTVGWAGTASTAHDYDLVSRSLHRALSTLPVDLAFVGLPPQLLPTRDDVGDVEPGRIRHVEWINGNERYLEAVAEFDIWVAPYRSNPFTDAKFPTKALEAGMLGIPLVASDIRPYREWITHGETGFLVPEHAPHLWGKYIRQLVQSHDLRRRMGEAARSRAARNIMQEVGRTWADALGV